LESVKQWHIGHLIISRSLRASPAECLNRWLNILDRKSASTYLEDIKDIEVNSAEMHCSSLSVPIQQPRKDQEARVQKSVCTTKSSFPDMKLKVGIRAKTAK